MARYIAATSSLVSPSGSSITTVRSGSDSSACSRKGTFGSGISPIQLSTRMPATTIAASGARTNQRARAVSRANASAATTDRHSAASMANRAGTRTAS